MVLMVFRIYGADPAAIIGFMVLMMLVVSMSGYAVVIHLMFRELTTIFGKL